MENSVLVGLKLFLKSDVFIEGKAAFTGFPGYLITKIIFFSSGLHILL